LNFQYDRVGQKPSRRLFIILKKRRHAKGLKSERKPKKTTPQTKIQKTQKSYALLKFLKIHHKFQKFSKSQNSACRFKATSQSRAVSLTKAVPQKANSTHKKPSHAQNGCSEP